MSARLDLNRDAVVGKYLKLFDEAVLKKLRVTGGFLFWTGLTEFTG